MYLDVRKVLEFVKKNAAERDALSDQLRAEQSKVNALRAELWLLRRELGRPTHCWECSAELDWADGSCFICDFPAQQQQQQQQQ